MNFTEKLRRLTTNRNKTALSVEAGLPSTAISNYLSKQQMPNAVHALHLARTLKVPFEWLVDEKMDWPPPVSVNHPAEALALAIFKLLDRLKD